MRVLPPHQKETPLPHAVRNGRTQRTASCAFWYISWSVSPSISFSINFANCDWYRSGSSSSSSSMYSATWPPKMYFLCVSPSSSLASLS